MAPRPRTSAGACPPKPEIKRRPLIGPEEADSLRRIFGILADSTRLRLLHALVRAGEMCVSDLSRAVGMKPQAGSNQLQRRVDRGILGSRRNGNYIHYRIIDPCVVGLLDLGMCLTEDAKQRRS